MARIANNIGELIGRTPLVQLNRLALGLQLVVVKLESQNPSPASRIASASLWSRPPKKQAKSSPEKTVLIEPTSGNTGIALAFIAAAQGISV